MTKILFIRPLVLLIVSAFTWGAAAQDKPFVLEKKWELSGLNNPESAVLDQTGSVLYLSNVNGAPTDKDGNGYISRISTDGKIISHHWITGLDAPKGLGIYKGKLYVADITNIVEIDIATAKIVAKYPAPEATFLNDITIDNNGNVYASNTFGFSGIYKLSKGKVELWLKSDALDMPNGLLAEQNRLLVAGWGEKFNPNNFSTEIPGKLVSVSYKDKSITDVTVPIGNLDGLTQTLHGYLLSNWMTGKLLYNAAGSNKSVDVLTLSQGTADIYFDKKTKTVFIPLMNDSKLVAYAIKQ